MSFLKKQGHCDRCNIKTNVTRMSRFNTDMCCPICLGIEKKHPEYQRAVDVENLAVRGGNMNFEGIGLPKDLIVSESQRIANLTQVCTISY